MGRPSKRQKSTFAKNIIARRKERGWNAPKLAEVAGMPFPTLRDIEAGISPGLEQNRQAIAQALGVELGELYLERGRHHSKPTESELRRTFQTLAMTPDEATIADLQIFLDHLQQSPPIQRAMALALLAGDYEVARPLVAEVHPTFQSWLKAL